MRFLESKISEKIQQCPPDPLSADYGTAQFVIPDILRVPPISQHGNVIEIAAFFGGADKLKEAVNQLQTLLYAA